MTRSSHVDAAAVIDLTRRLVRLPSVNAPLLRRSEEPAARLVAETMRQLGLDVDLDEVSPGRPNVVGTADGGLPGPTLLFEGHTDVVTEGDPSCWSFDPFVGDVVDGRLRGRGSADMKGGVAAMLHACASLVAARPFPGRIVVAALVDEEGMMSGVKHFVASGRAGGIDAAIVCEPEGGEVCIAQKGALRLRVEAEGRMAHGAMPDRGRNPIPALVELLAGLGEEERSLQAAHGRHPLLGDPYLTPTFFRAGEASQANVIPSSASCALDVRTVPALDHGELVRRIEALAGDIGARHDVTLRVAVVDDRPATEIGPDALVVEALVRAHEEVTGERPPFGGVPGTTDGTILWRDGRIPVVVYGPGGKWIAHQADEYVDVAELAQAAEVYRRAAERYLWEGAGLDVPPA
ncbi:MAG TPA: M20 family metallopeptidase [Acidimicrobiales bacterium]|nr:M20 family metallopeptidase [Acidimicrobiales bacterium]